jgi:hypothetical protein
MKSNYWKPEHDNLIILWKTADTRQQFLIYERLRTPITYMAKSILYRYFSFNQNDTQEILSEAINHLFCNLHKYDPSNNAKPYSYVQTILKNRFHEVVRFRKKIFTIELEYLDSLETNTEIEYNYVFNPYDDRLDFDDVFNRLERSRLTILEYINSNSKISLNTKKKLKTEAEFLNKTVEFINEYKDSAKLSAVDILEGVTNRMSTSEFTVRNYMYKYLKTSAFPCNEYESKVDKKYSKLGVVNEDYPPIENDDKRKRRRDFLMNQEIYSPI